ncbi:BMC domain-containing protein [Vibrio sp. 10N.222.51.C12]|uniref:BMC domain-containing protein n=1 Tax=unclassified Vibrio TaxID=2614977 RepID=UPI000C83D496|nr:BMC domain-containing protein [Vibrio sp. 10N.286.48.B7]PMH81203.1 propanediol utilization protein [Vibrio sp. 10N.286.48.B7]
MHHAIGLIEVSSIAIGIEATDTMLTSANVELLVSKTICPGKYIALVGGEIGAVQQAIANGKYQADYLLVDSFVIANVHASVLPSLSGVTEINNRKAIGIVETYSVAACISAADAAVKSANIELVRIHMAFGIGGKCYMIMNGDITDVKTAVTEASNHAGEKGLLVKSSCIAKPAQALWQHLL